MFSPGQLVKCINNDAGYIETINKGKIYTVKYVGASNFVYVVDNNGKLSGGWFKYRFVPVNINNFKDTIYRLAQE